MTLFYESFNMYCSKQFIWIKLLKHHADFMKLGLFFLHFADIVTEA